MTAPFPIVSFGQGCEGEPLLMWETIKESIIEIRKHTDKGSININSNGSDPKAVKILAAAGLDSLRVSTNSVRPEIYNPYYRPNNYTFDDIVESLKEMSAAGKWTSINYFVFPGMTDSVAEYEALRKFIKDTDLKMIQWRNFNIDPDWYLGKIGVTEVGEIMGVKHNDLHLGNILICDEYVWNDYYITHGDLYDGVIKLKWLAHLGSVGYELAIQIDRLLKRFGYKRSVSKWAKDKVKNAVKFITDFEKQLAYQASKRNCKGVICGHIHKPEDKHIHKVHYSYLLGSNPMWVV
jgi:hypothetical protein